MCPRCADFFITLQAKCADQPSFLWTIGQTTLSTMKRINLKNALPAVFAGREDTGSQIWLRDVAFEKGKYYLISAESGTGKSSLCSYIYGFRSDYSGAITFDGTHISTLSVKDWCDIRCHHLAYLPQELRLFHELTALENVLLKNNITGFKSKEEILRLFDTFGIADKTDSLVAHLSIGQQQRVAIIRTLCQPYDFLVLDEPVSHLDSTNNAIVAEVVCAEAKKQGAGIIATSVGNNVMINIDEEYKL